MNDKYLKSKQAIAEAANTSRNTVYKWMRSPDFPRETPDGWERVKVLEFAKAALAKAAKCQTGEHGELKAEKIRLECDRLEQCIRVEKVKADAAEFDAAVRRKEFINQMDVREMVQEIRRAFDVAMSRFTERVKIRGDVDLLIWAEAAEDAVLLHLKQLLTEEGAQ